MTLMSLFFPDSPALECVSVVVSFPIRFPSDNLGSRVRVKSEKGRRQ